jgi:hypothetical protein
MSSESHSSCGNPFAVGIPVLWESLCCGNPCAVGIPLWWESLWCGNPFVVGVPMVWESLCWGGHDMDILMRQCDKVAGLVCNHHMT